ncbi:nitrate ABC transporter substrate-binding protein [Caballeronia arationis]|jgi:sulfonate transport system substrate-binding protein|uniref:ABC-type nitrate/sulfonate/bicarbonate transport system, substrate-binding protein n=1 Tax=Caballeronia arationis TaxID=1777142 RepID=A0A7Z7IE12_9BURK|nr:ABC transporter substrate-binding protein [Caballeronia arationis]SAK95649.1 nitrate ABC transporter substrate-binding protein [Caballeronia arationis]SOE88940.1 ABC-type nitrate/sulfonate/bicarbonate transport system, substrate-binding protein [Caballeronia arationis]
MKLRLLLKTLTMTLGVIASATAFAAGPDVVKIGVAQQGTGDPPVFGGSPAATAQLQHRVEDALKTDGTKVEWIFFKGAGPAVNEALANKQIDFAYQGDLPAVLGRANGLKTHLLVASNVRAGVYLAVPPDSDIKGVKDLKGKRVGIFRGTNLQLVADNVLKENGLTERDLRVINLDSAAAQAALASKGVDAVFLDYNLFKLQRQGLAKIVYASRDGGLQLTRQAHLLVLEDFERAHPEIVQKVVTSVVQASQWSSDETNRSALFELWSKSGVPAESWQSEYANQQLKDRSSPLIDPFLVARYQAVADDALRLNLIRQPVSVNGWFEPKYLDEALKTLKLQAYWPRFDASGKPIAS